MKEITSLAKKFRDAICAALHNGEFTDNAPLDHFPDGCCGIVSELLGQYFLDNGMMTYYICGYYYFKNTEISPQSHAWLMTDANIIIDITGDQFKNDDIFLNYDIPVYVGQKDEFHDLFEIEEKNQCVDLYKIKGTNLNETYKIIQKYIESKNQIKL